MVERHLAKVNVASSNLVSRSIFLLSLAPWPSGKAQVCKTFIPQFKSGWRLHCRSGGIGRRKGLKILRAAMPVRVQVPPSAPNTTILIKTKRLHFYGVFLLFFYFYTLLTKLFLRPIFSLINFLILYMI